MELFIVEVEFVAGNNAGQVWKFYNLNIIQVIELYETFNIKTIRESKIYVKVNYEPSKRITIKDFIYNFNYLYTY